MVLIIRVSTHLLPIITIYLLFIFSIYLLFIFTIYFKTFVPFGGQTQDYLNHYQCLKVRHCHVCLTEMFLFTKFTIFLQKKNFYDLVK